MIVGTPFRFNIHLKVFLMKILFLCKVNYREDCIVEFREDIIVNNTFLYKCRILKLLGVIFTIDVVRGSVVIESLLGLHLLKNCLITGTFHIKCEDKLLLEDIICDTLIVYGNRTSLSIRNIKCNVLVMKSISNLTMSNIYGLKRLSLIFSHLTQLQLSGIEEVFIRNSKVNNLVVENVGEVDIESSKTHSLEATNIVKLILKEVKFKSLVTDNVREYLINE